MSISAKYPAVKALSLRLSDDISKLERLTEPGQVVFQEAIELERSVANGIEQLARDILELEQLAALEGPRREMWKERVARLSEELQFLKQTLARIVSRNQPRHDPYRAELLSDYKAAALGGATDYLIAEHESLTRSQQMVADSMDMGAQAIKSMMRQRERIRSARQANAEARDSLSRSTTLLGLIQRREFWNKVITYGGMALILIVFFVLVYFTRWRKARTADM